LWGALDKDNDGFVTIEELSVPTALALASFQKWARRSPLLGSCAAIWESPEAADASRKRSGTWYSEKKMLMGTLQDTLSSLGWPGVNVAKTRSLVFNVLDSSGCGLVTRADLEWVDKWKPVEWVYAAPSPDGLEDMKDLLVGIYGHPLRAWRCLLDQDDNNCIDYKEFKHACHRLGFRGNVAGAWRALDVDLSGRVSMKQFDPPSAELLASFKEWAEANFGSVKHFFKTLYTGDNHAITLQELKRICHKLHWHGDVQLLFDCLDVDKRRDANTDGKRSLTCDELAFLDSWHVEPTEEELKAEELANTGSRTLGRRASAQKVSQITERLAAPILGRGRRTLADLDIQQPLEGEHSRKSLVDVAAVAGFLSESQQRNSVTTPSQEVSKNPRKSLVFDPEISQEARSVERQRRTLISDPEGFPLRRISSSPDAASKPTTPDQRQRRLTAQRSSGQLAPLKDEPRSKQVDPRFKESAILFESALSAAGSSPTFGRQAWASKKSVSLTHTL